MFRTDGSESVSTSAKAVDANADGAAVSTVFLLDRRVDVPAAA
jgi:hypothetical protein